MYYESGYFTVFALILGVGIVLAIYVVTLTYIRKVKEGDSRYVWFSLAAMTLTVTVPAFLNLVRPFIGQEAYGMHSEENTFRLYWFGLWFTLTNVLWIIGMIAISKEKKIK